MSNKDNYLEDIPKFINIKNDDVINNDNIYTCEECRAKTEEKLAFNRTDLDKKLFICDVCKSKEKQLEFENKDFKEPSYGLQIHGVNSLLDLLVLAEISKTDLRVYQYLWSLCAFQENIIFDINQGYVANYLKMKKPNINRSINNLIDGKLIEKLNKNQYRFRIFEKLDDLNKYE